MSDHTLPIQIDMHQHLLDLAKIAEDRVLEAPISATETRTENALIAYALRLAVYQSQEPSEAEIEMVARAICASYPGYPNPDHDDGTCWQYHVIDARVAIRAVRGLDSMGVNNG